MPGIGGPDGRQPLEVVLDRVLAAHPLQDGVVARLDRQVEVLAHGRAIGHGRDEPVREVPRVRGHEAQPRDAETVHGADELGEVRPALEVQTPARPAVRVDVPESRLRGQVVAVRVDVLAEQGHFLVAGVGQLPGLRDDVVERVGCAPARD